MKLTASAFALLFAIALTGSAAHAELFRCTGPDGKTIFTDQKHTCPGAEPTEPTGVVHRAETPEAAPAAPSPSAPRDARRRVSADRSQASPLPDATAVRQTPETQTLSPAEKLP